MWAISRENTLTALPPVPLVVTWGEIELCQAAHWRANAREGSWRRKLRVREEQAQRYRETLITLQINARCWQGSAVGKAGNQIASPEPCPSVGVTIHTCKSTSTEQRLREREAEDGKKKKASAQAADQSGKHYHKHKNWNSPSIPVHRCFA